MRVPESFWKIVAWVDDAGLKAAGFILDQTDEIDPWPYRGGDQLW